jgi:putative oxidoreductase
VSDTLSSISTFAGRLLMAHVFLLSGPGFIANPVETAALMASGGLPQSVGLATLAGLFKIFGGLALVAGIKTRWVALALAAFTLVAGALFHNFWAVPADQQFVQQLLFTKNVAIVGGLLFVAGAGPGGWSWDAFRLSGWPAGNRPGRARA